MHEAQLEANVDGLGDIYRSHGDFDKALDAILKRSTEVMSARDLAYASMHSTDITQKKHWTYASYVREGSLFVPGAENQRIWLRESMVLQNPSAAVKAHGDRRQYFPETFNVDEYLEKIGPDNYLVLPKEIYEKLEVGPRGMKSYPHGIFTSSFGDDPRTVWLFKDLAKEYGEFLYDLGIIIVDTWMLNGPYASFSKIDSQRKPFANQLFIGTETYKIFTVCGDHRSLDSSYFNYPVRGIDRK